MELIGHGTALEYNTTGSTYVTIAGLLSIDFGSNKVDTHDVTNMQTSGISRAFIGGLKDSGDVSAKFNKLPSDATQADIFAAEDGAIHNFKVVLPGAVETLSFAAIVTGIDRSHPDDKTVTFSVKFKITGDITLS